MFHSQLKPIKYIRTAKQRKSKIKIYFYQEVLRYSSEVKIRFPPSSTTKLSCRPRNSIAFSLSKIIPSFEFQLQLLSSSSIRCVSHREKERERKKERGERNEGGRTSGSANIQTRLLKNNQSQARFASILNFSPLILKIVKGHTSKVVSTPPLIAFSIHGNRIHGVSAFPWRRGWS